MPGRESLNGFRSCLGSGWGYAMSDEFEEADLTDVFRALANPATRHFVELLAREGRTADPCDEHGQR